MPALKAAAYFQTASPDFARLRRAGRDASIHPAIQLG